MAYEGWHSYGNFYGPFIDKIFENCKQRFPHVEWQIINGHEIIYKNGDINGLTLPAEK